MVAVFVGYVFYMGNEQEKADKIKQENTAKQVTEDDADEEEAVDEANLTEAEKEAKREQEAKEAKEAELQYHGSHELIKRAGMSAEPIKYENDFIEVTFSPIGGKITSVVLKEYYRYAEGERTERVNLINPGSARFGFDIHTQGPDVDPINTNDYCFDVDEDVTADSYIITMRLPFEDEQEPIIAEDGSVTPVEPGYIEYKYTINKTGDPSKDYLVGFEFYQHNLTPYLWHDNEIILRWGNQSMHNEKSFTNENMASTIMFYDREEEESDEIDSDGKRMHCRNLSWIALKQQYFTSALITNGVMHAGLGFKTGSEKSDFVKEYDTRIIIPNDGEKSYEFAFYYGPNDYNVMKNVAFGGKENNLEEIIPMGGWLIGWINRILTIPVFNWLKDHGLSFGLIILILTLIVKLIILPLTYKSYMSTAKMRAIRPEMEEINQKYPKQEDAMKKQQALMELYRKAGVSPMGGCLPLLIQMPILWAMFRFFPASIELRGESFLWADDLSSYDSVLDLPFPIPFYGSHVSLFALLMAISLFGYSFYSYKQQAATTAGQPGAGVMKFMMVYFMPVMMLFFFNGYSSGLCYYYFLSQMFTMLIMYIIRRSVDDNKVRERLLANAAKPKKKSRFQQRYEEMLKQQQEQLNREQRRQRR